MQPQTISTFLQPLPEPDWTAVSAVAALVAVVVTCISSYYAFQQAVRSYRDNARSTRLAHMHRLFGDYLGHEFNYQVAQEQGAKEITSKHSLAAFKMYTLEEMWLWLEREERDTPVTDLERHDHERLIRGWRSTIDYHLGKSDEANLVGFVLHRGCYSPQFVALVLDHRVSRELFQRWDGEAIEVYRQRLESQLNSPRGETFAAGGVGDTKEAKALLESFYRGNPYAPAKDAGNDVKILRHGEGFGLKRQAAKTASGAPLRGDLPPYKDRRASPGSRQPKKT